MLCIPDTFISQKKISILFIRCILQNNHLRLYFNNINWLNIFSLIHTTKNSKDLYSFFIQFKILEVKVVELLLPCCGSNYLICYFFDWQFLMHILSCAAFVLKIFICPFVVYKYLTTTLALKIDRNTLLVRCSPSFKTCRCIVSTTYIWIYFTCTLQNTVYLGVYIF